MHLGVTQVCWITVPHVWLQNKDLFSLRWEWWFIFLLLLSFCLFVLETGSWLAQTSLCRLGWPWTHRDQSHVSWALGLKAQATKVLWQLCLCKTFAIMLQNPRDAHKHTVRQEGGKGREGGGGRGREGKEEGEGEIVMEQQSRSGSEISRLPSCEVRVCLLTYWWKINFILIPACLRILPTPVIYSDEMLRALAPWIALWMFTLVADRGTHWSWPAIGKGWLNKSPSPEFWNFNLILSCEATRES